MERKVGVPLLSQCREARAWDHNQYPEALGSHAPTSLQPEGVVQYPRVEFWKLNKLWDTGSRKRLIQGHSGKQMEELESERKETQK